MSQLIEIFILLIFAWYKYNSFLKVIVLDQKKKHNLQTVFKDQNGQILWQVWLNSQSKNTSHFSPGIGCIGAVLGSRYIFFTDSRLRLLLEKALLPAPSSRFYKFRLPAPAPNSSKKVRLLGAVFRGFYRIRLRLWLSLIRPCSPAPAPQHCKGIKRFFPRLFYGL